MSMVRRLTAQDGPVLLACLEDCPGVNRSASVVIQELPGSESHLWFGAFEPRRGRLVAAHRAMLVDGCLLLQGLYVAREAPDARTGLRLAAAVRDSAEEFGADAVVAIVSRSARERHIAGRLGLRPVGPAFYRYRFPIEGRGEAGQSALFGDVPVRRPPMYSAASLIFGAVPRSVGWAANGDTAVFLSNPCFDIAEAPALVDAVGQTFGGTSLSLPIPASQLVDGFRSLSMGATRRSVESEFIAMWTRR